MKKIEVTPEWILTELPHMHIADGEGNMTFYTDNVTDVRWITLALDTLGIQLQTYDEGDDEVIFFWFKVMIEDFKEHCPKLYLKWKGMNDKAKVDRPVDAAFAQFFIELEEREIPHPTTVQFYRDLKNLLEDYCKTKGQPLNWEMIENRNDRELKKYLLNRKANNATVEQVLAAKSAFIHWRDTFYYVENKPVVAH